MQERTAWAAPCVVFVCLRVMVCLLVLLLHGVSQATLEKLDPLEADMQVPHV